jgi:iron complex outermembrane receptor protein
MEATRPGVQAPVTREKPMSAFQVKNRGALRASCSALALSLGASLLTAIAASAQTAPAAAPQDTAEVEEVVVTGFRASLTSAINTKRRSDNIVDVIKADDMASFPDANLAESIQRIPGVSITRDGGEGRNITVRGLGGDFVRTTLNGIEAYSATTGSTLGVVAGINRSRGFDFSTFASELFNSVTVSKSQSAEMDEGSLAATVDLQTARPFDKSGFRAAASAQGAYYDNNKTKAPRFAGLISDTWGNFGALFSLAYNTRKQQEDGYSDTSQSDYSDANNGFCGTAVDIASQAGSQVVNTAIPYVNALSGAGNRPAGQCFSGLPSDPTAYAAINQPNVFLPRNPGLGRFILDQKRLGMTGALQWRPSDRTDVTLDVVYSKFDQDRADYALSNASLNRNVNGASAAFPLFAGRVDAQIMDAHVLPSGQVDYMKINNVDIKHIEEKSETTTETHQIGLNIEHTFNDRLSGNVKIGHSGSDFQQPWDVLMSYDGFNKAGYVWDARDSLRRPYINYGYDVTNPANVTFTNAGTGLTPDIRVVKAAVFNTLSTVEGNVKYKLTDVFTVKAGVSLKSFDFQSKQVQRLYANNGATGVTATGTIPFNFAQFAADFPGSAPLSETLTGFGKQLKLPAGSVTSWVVPDVSAYIDKLGLLCNCSNKYGDFTLAINSALGNNRAVKEEDTGAYVQVNFDSEVLDGRRLRGNAGVRYVKTDLDATGYTSLTSQITVNNKYSDWLPSLNLALDVMPNLVARFAYAGVMARPSFGNLTPGGAVNTTFGAQTATIGNPFLDPYRAKNYDFSLEWYPNEGTILSATFFDKEIGSSIQTIATTEAYGNTGLPLGLLPAGQDASTPYLVTRSRNTQGGYIRGVELSFQQPFKFLPGVLSNTGTMVNYTYVDSSVLYYLSTGTATTPATQIHDQFLNVSPHSVNATLYYEDSKLSARVSVAYRDEYLTALPFKSEVPDANGSYATTNVDASISYQLTPHFKLTADALNITNQEADQWSGKQRRSQRVFSTTGRQFFFGGSYVF